MNKLLLLEDDESLIDGLKYSLEKNGFVLDVANTVQEAREKLKGRIFYDLLLLDVTLPDGTGFSLCEEIRRAGEETPIIFLTAADEETNILPSLLNWENCAPAYGPFSGEAQGPKKKQTES